MTGYNNRGLMLYSKTKGKLFLIAFLFMIGCQAADNTRLENTGSIVKPDDSSLVEKNDSLKESRQADADSSTQKSMPAIKNISMVLKKMENKEQLNDVDYDIIGNFLSQNKDESLSEGAGYALFEYLKDNRSANENYLSFLNQKGETYKENMLGRLVQIMCIDLGDEKYTYEKLISSFSLFKESKTAQKAFKTCVDNWVD